MKLSLVQRLRQNWNRSLRFRLLALGLMPLLIAFPVVIAVLVVVGGEKADNLLFSNLRSSLAGFAQLPRPGPAGCHCQGGSAGQIGTTGPVAARTGEPA
jgi:hypothetical protein